MAGASSHASQRAAPLADTQTEDLRRVAERYAVALTPAIEELLASTSNDGPIARQFLPDLRPGYSLRVVVQARSFACYPNGYRV